MVTLEGRIIPEDGVEKNVVIRTNPDGTLTHIMSWADNSNALKMVAHLNRMTKSTAYSRQDAQFCREQVVLIGGPRRFLVQCYDDPQQRCLPFHSQDEAIAFMITKSPTNPNFNMKIHVMERGVTWR